MRSKSITKTKMNMKKIIALTLTMFCLTSCSGMKEKIQKAIDSISETETVDGTEENADAKLCIYGQMDEKPILWVNGVQVTLSDAGKSLSMENEGQVIAAMARGNDVYALCHQGDKIILYANNTATVLDNTGPNAGPAQIVMQNGKPVVYAATSDETGGNQTLCRYADGLKSTIVGPDALHEFYLRSLKVVDGKVYGTATTMSQFGEAVVLVEGRMTQLEPVASEAHMVAVNGADVVVCGNRSTDPDNFSDAEEAENPSAAALWRNGKPENLKANCDAVAYAKDGNDEYVLIKSANGWDDEIGGFKNLAITLWKNGKEAETIFKDLDIRVFLFNVENGKMTIVGSEDSNVFVWKDGNKETIYNGPKDVYLWGANY